MNRFSLILSGLQAAIAARAARDRSLTVLLVALWGRIARMGLRLERLVALWRAGKLPKKRAPRAVPARDRAADNKPKITYPSAPGWLRQRLGHEVGAYASQLHHLLTDAECAAFLAAVPQAGRILRPLLRMLSADPLPVAVRRAQPPVPGPMPAAPMPGIVSAPVAHFLEA